jgi:hypothetical protein
VSLADRIRQLYSEIEASTGVPTTDQRRLAGEAHEQLKAVVVRLNAWVALPPSSNPPPRCRAATSTAVALGCVATRAEGFQP